MSHSSTGARRGTTRSGTAPRPGRPRSIRSDAETRAARPARATRRFSAGVGIVLVGLALLWSGWLYLHQTNSSVPFLSFRSSSTPAPGDPLAAAGITLSTPAQGQQPQLTRAQALLLANQKEPTVAARAGLVDARYTLFSYKSADAAQPVFNAVPVWMVHYTRINEPPPDTSADSHASRAPHDFYVFLGAQSGKELLAIWL